MTQDEIRRHLGRSEAVVIQVASAGDGSPAIAQGDTFFFVRDQVGEPKKMPFATIVIKDYEGFDSDSNLNRGGLYRLNLDVGKETFEARFGFQCGDLPRHRGKFDFTAANLFFPHPVYGAYGWISIINPENEQADAVRSLLDLSLERALQRGS